MRTYERPTLTRAGNFTKVTGLGGSGPRDISGRHQSFAVGGKRPWAVTRLFCRATSESSK